ncbi:MAG: LuxR C-terminal-related transcriptional regulator [Acidimicrobiales bacterium]
MSQCHATEEVAVWLSLDEADNDPVIFWSAMIEATREAIPGFGEAYLHRLTTTGPSVTEEIVTAMANELDEGGLPVRFFLDDLHLIESVDCLRPLHRLIRRRPEAVRFFVAARGTPPLPLARLRVEGQLDEIDWAALAMSVDEAELLFERLGHNLEPSQLTELVDRTEGWPAGLRLAAMAITDVEDADDFVTSFGGTDRAVASYLVAEVLEAMEPADRRFLAETAVLRRLSGDLCEAVTGRRDSQELLETFEQSNAFLIPLDRAGVWYRYHHLFAELLVSRLEREDPAAIEDLHGRAFEWLRVNGDPQEAIRHAMAAGRLADAAELVRDNWWHLLNTGRHETVRTMIERFDETEVMSHQPLALAAALVYAAEGDHDRARLFIDAVGEPVGGEAPLIGAADGWSAVALIRGNLALDGVERALVDGLVAHEREPLESPWRPVAALIVGLATVMKGDSSGAEPYFEEARLSEDEGIRSYALAELALARLAQGRVEEAATLADEACRRIGQAGLDDIIQAGSAYAATALIALARGDRGQATSALESAGRPMDHAGSALPMDVMRVQINLADAALQLEEYELASRYVNRATRIGAMIGDTGAMGSELARLRGSRAGSSRYRPGDETPESPFTTRELEVLALLKLGLTSREIAAELFLSKNTVKTYRRRIYNKLGASSRAGALERAAEIGLVVNGC